MRFMKNLTFSKVLLATISVLGFWPASALAQEASGTFTLNKEVRWGTITLQPGAYTYKLERHASEMVFLRGSTGQAGFIVMANSVSTLSGPESDRLLLQRHGDQWFVSSMVVGVVGEQLYFKAPTISTETARGRSPTPDKLASLSKP
jgi:hypothetical protein